MKHNKLEPDSIMNEIKKRWWNSPKWAKTKMMTMGGPYFGDSSTKIVHDLNRAKPECKIGEVPQNNKKYFDPDTLEQTIKEDYKKCRCIS